MGFDKRYDYSGRYPEGLDLHPDSETHRHLLAAVLKRANDAKSAIQARYARWREIDKARTAYIPLDAEEKRIREKDPRKPVSIVVPVLWATQETLMTYLSEALLDIPTFRYKWVGPEDVVGAALLEKIIEVQTARAGMVLDLYAAIADGISYGVGAVAPSWFTEVDAETGETIWEGNQLSVISPYDYLPDPTVPAHRVQDGEFLGYIEHTNVMRLLRDEVSDSTLFNVKYLQHIDARSSLYGQTEGLYDRDKVSYLLPSDVGNKADVLHMYVDLIPSMWRLSAGDEPQKWLFSVAGDRVIIRARPVELRHGMFPVSVVAPDFDGKSPVPLSRLEIILGLQECINFLINSHIKSVRKVIHDMIVVDPQLVNLNDLLHPADGKIIRMRRRAWGGGITNAISQLRVQDVTQQHMNDASAMMYLVQQISGAVDILQGIARTSGERRSATEMAGVRSSALSRLRRLARTISAMFMVPLGRMLASHTQQFLSRPMYVAIVGRWERELTAELGDRMERGMYPVAPEEIRVGVDVLSSDGTIPDDVNVSNKMALFQLVRSDPELRATHDVISMFRHVARLSGWGNVADFARQGPGVEATVRPEEEIEQGVEAGNLVPLEELTGGV